MIYEAHFRVISNFYVPSYSSTLFPMLKPNKAQFWFELYFTIHCIIPRQWPHTIYIHPLRCCKPISTINNYNADCLHSDNSLYDISNFTKRQSTNEFRILITSEWNENCPTITTITYITRITNRNNCSIVHKHKLSLYTLIILRFIIILHKQTTFQLSLREHPK